MSEKVRDFNLEQRKAILYIEQPTQPRVTHVLLYYEEQVPTPKISITEMEVFQNSVVRFQMTMTQVNIRIWQYTFFFNLARSQVAMNMYLLISALEGIGPTKSIKV